MSALSDLDKALEAAVESLAAVEQRRAELAGDQLRMFAEAKNTQKAISHFFSVRGADGRTGSVPCYNRARALDDERARRVEELTLRPGLTVFEAIKEAVREEQRAFEGRIYK